MHACYRCSCSHYLIQWLQKVGVKWNNSCNKNHHNASFLINRRAMLHRPKKSHKHDPKASVNASQSQFIWTTIFGEFLSNATQPKKEKTQKHNRKLTFNQSLSFSTFSFPNSSADVWFIFIWTTTFGTLFGLHSISQIPFHLSKKRESNYM